ncbi:hypothetical protein CYLTODRAFT_363551, partial [Cylindrobasidium torrendii FP15055 ss-10]
VGLERIAGFVCDSTGNTLGARRLMSKEVPTCLVFPDACHHIHSLLKDLAKLPYFEPMTIILRKTIRFFNKSHPGIFAFATAREDCGVPRSLESIGKTRFGSIFWAALSMQLNLLPLEYVFKRVDLEFEYTDAFGPVTFANGLVNDVCQRYRLLLDQFIKLGMPGTKALACLESNTTNAGDFYLYWHSLVASILGMLEDHTPNQRGHSNPLPVDVRDQIQEIVHFRHAQIFTDTGPRNMHTPAYEAAAYLNPGMRLLAN